MNEKINNNSLILQDYWLNLILNAAQNAYNSIKNLIGTEKAREMCAKGAGGDTTLFIDKLSEEVIMKELTAINVPFKLITEEYGEKIYSNEDYEENSIKDHIIVDPIDGSKNAAWGLPYSAISIAHASGNELKDITCGVIVNIYTGDIFYAKKGMGAYLNDRRIFVNENSEFRKSLFGINLSLEESLQSFAVRYKFLFEQPLKIRSIGSNALGFAYVASGSLNVFIDLQKKCRVLDIAAGYILLKEAGGEIWDCNGNPLNAPLYVKSRVSFLGINKGLKNYFSSLIPKISAAHETQPEYLQ